MTEETYNGWKNYPTWAVNLWLSNDEGLYGMTLEAVDDEWDDAPYCLNVGMGIWTVDEARRFNTADRLREMIEEMSAENCPTSGMYADLLAYALAEVDWTEIAEAWLETAREQREYA